MIKKVTFFYYSTKKDRQTLYINDREGQIMTNITGILTNIICILFPFLCYMIYVAYCNDINKKESNLLLSVVLFISMYLSHEHSIGITPPIMLNIPLIIAYLKEKKDSILIMSIFIVFNYNIVFGLPLSICIIEYIAYYGLYILIKSINKEKLKYFYILTFSIIKATILIIETPDIYPNVNIIIKMVIVLSIFVLSAILIINLLEKSEQIINLNITIKELEREKQLRCSLFNIAHEIKNPLAVCKGYLEMLNFKNPNHEKYIPIIQTELERSITLMNDMLNFTKIKISPEYMDINVLLEDIKLSVSPITKNKNIKVNIKVSKDELYVYADYIRLKQVFVNIIKNCIENLEDNSNQKIINIEVTLKRNQIITTINDNSKGMTKNELRELNKPFYTPNGRNRALEATLVNEIIKCHDGEISFMSKLNKGTTAVIKLPYKA